MTVQELRDKLAQFDGRTNVVIYRENGDEVQLFEIDAVLSQRGTPVRNNGKPGFQFDNAGPISWVLVDVSPAE